MQCPRRLIAASILLLAFCAQALGAGSISLSLSQQFDSQGRPLSGGLLYFFVAGTTTPQNAYQDTTLTIPYPNPIVLDASGRVPPFYLADGLIKIRLSTSGGVTVIAADNLLVIGPSTGGGGGGAIDATSVLATGDVKARYGTGTLSGFVRANGRTIGSATSGATERANADCQALFEYLWTTDSTLTVSGGRGASANADWVANKTLILPDMRGRAIAGMDDMGATAASRLTTNGFGTLATVLGAVGGAETQTLTAAQMPAHNHSATGTISVTGTNAVEPAHFHGVGALGVDITVGGGLNGLGVISGSGAVGVPSGAVFNVYPVGGYSTIAGTISGSTAVAGAHSHNWTGGGTTSITVNNTGSGNAHPIMSPAIVMTFYMKL